MEGLIRALARVEAELRDLLQAVHQHLVSNQHTEPPKLAELLADHKHAFDLKLQGHAMLHMFQTSASEVMRPSTRPLKHACDTEESRLEASSTYRSSTNAYFRSAFHRKQLALFARPRPIKIKPPGRSIFFCGQRTTKEKEQETKEREREGETERERERAMRARAHTHTSNSSSFRHCSFVRSLMLQSSAINVHSEPWRDFAT